MNELDNINDALVRLGKVLSETLSKALKSIQDIIDGLEPLGYSEQSQDEQFVQAFANAIYQGFEIRGE